MGPVDRPETSEIKYQHMLVTPEKSENLSLHKVHSKMSKWILDATYPQQFFLSCRALN